MVHRVCATAALCIGLLLGVPAPGHSETVYNRVNLGDVNTLDPHKTSTVEDGHVMRDIYDGLLAYDKDGNAIPGAAESWTISADGTVYTFKMRSKGRWSNGDPVTAADFVYALRRQLDPATGSKYAFTLYAIKNAEEVNKSKAALDQLGVRALDPATLEITLRGPTPYFLELMTHQSSYPVHRGSIEKFGDAWIKPGNLVTNGPFMVTEYVPKDHIKLVKNPYYFDAAAIKLDAVNYIPVEDRSVALKRFEAGELDTIYDIPTEQAAYVREKFKGQFFVGPMLGTYFYPLRGDKPPLNNTRLRRAIALMIDRDYLAEKIWGGTMLPSYSVVPPGIKGYTPVEADYKKLSPLEREDEARKIMTELGYSPEKPLKLEIRYNTGENHKNTAVAIADMMKPFGIDCTLINTDGKTHYSYLQDGGDFQIARAGWFADYKDPQTFIDLSQAGGGHNYSRYANPDFDAVRAKAGVEPDVAKRMALLAQAEAYLVRDVADLPLLYYAYKNLISKKIKGFVPNVMDVHPSRWVSKD